MKTADVYLLAQHELRLQLLQERKEVIEKLKSLVDLSEKYHEYYGAAIARHIIATLERKNGEF